MKKGRIVRGTALIVASALLMAAALLYADTPPDGLLRKIAEREAATAAALQNYTYRQSLTIQEFNEQGLVSGQYREARDIIFSPDRGRYEQVVEAPKSTLARIKLTDEDFADIRNIQPFLLTPDKVRLYAAQFKGEENMDGSHCFLESIRPRQILSTQRFFEGMLWVRESDFAIVRSEGQAVPQIETLTTQNLFPHFTTMRREVDGKWFFPFETYADDTLYFRDWPQRVKVLIRYMNYKRFGADSTITFGGENTVTPQPEVPAAPTVVSPRNPPTPH